MLGLSLEEALAKVQTAGGVADVIRTGDSSQRDGQGTQRVVRARGKGGQWTLTVCHIPHGV